MHILNQVQVNLIYNTNRDLFLWIVDVLFKFREIWPTGNR